MPLHERRERALLSVNQEPFQELPVRQAAAFVAQGCVAKLPEYAVDSGCCHRLCPPTGDWSSIIFAQIWRNGCSGFALFREIRRPSANSPWRYSGRAPLHGLPRQEGAISDGRVLETSP